MTYVEAGDPQEAAAAVRAAFADRYGVDPGRRSGARRAGST